MSKFSIFKNKADDEPDEVAVPTLQDTQQVENEWLEEGYEGQLSVDVYQTEDAVVIKSTIAGVKPDDLDVTVNNDLVTIRGTRQQEDEIRPDDYFYQECYWGGFSRSIILPVACVAMASGFMIASVRSMVLLRA